MKIDLHIHGDVKGRAKEDGRDFLLVLECLASQFEAIAAGRRLIQHRGEHCMALTVQEQSIVDRFDKATTDISDKIDALIAAGVSNSPEFVAKLQSLADGLDALGKPGTPVPGPGPQPTA